jgi:hypothetical protein
MSYNNLSLNDKKNKLVNDDNNKYYRINLIFSPVHLCDQMTQPKANSIYKNLSENSASSPRAKSFATKLYIDSTEYITQKNPSVILDYKVTSNSNNSLPLNHNFDYGKRVIDLNDTSISGSSTFDNKISDHTPPLYINNGKIVIDDQASGKVSAEDVRKKISTMPVSNHRGRVLAAQIKRLGDYSQISYAYDLSEILIDSILKSTDDRFKDEIDANIMYTQMTNAKNANDSGTNYSEGKSDLNDLLGASGITKDSQRKILKKRILHVAGDGPAFCWCVFNRVNAIYYKADTALSCIFDYDF